MNLIDNSDNESLTYPTKPSKPQKPSSKLSNPPTADSSLVRKIPIPIPRVNPSSAKGDITAPKSVFKHPCTANQRPKSAVLSRDSSSLDRNSRPKSMRPNILQSAFGANNTDALAVRKFETLSVTEKVVKSRGTSSARRSGSFNRPRSIVEVGEVGRETGQLEEREGAKALHSHLYSGVSAMETRGDVEGGVPPSTLLGVDSDSVGTTRRGLRTSGSCHTETQKEDKIRSQSLRLEHASADPPRPLSKAEAKMKHLMVVSAADDHDYDLENEMLDSAALRPESLNCGRGGARIESGPVRVDSFRMQYGYDSTDSDSSDGSESSSDDGGGGDGVRGRDVKRAPKEGDSSSNTSTITEAPTPSTRKIPKGKKEKTAIKKLKSQKRRDASASDTEAGAPPLSEREKRVARYRNTLQRIDRKLQKEGFGEEVKCVDENDENATIRFLLSGRVYGYPCTDGSVPSNYLSFLKQKHPLLSLFMHHRHHPLKTPRRLVVFCCVLFFAFIMSVVLLEGFYFDEEFICASGCGDTPSTNSSFPEGGERLCHGGANDGVEFEKYQSSCEYYPPWVIGFIAGALITPYDLMLKFLATCGCVQGRSFFQNNCCGTRCKSMVTNSGDVLLGLFVLINLLCTLAALYRAYFVLELDTVLATFILSEIVSFGYWVGWTFPYFSFKFPSDRKVFYKQLRKQRKREWRRAHPHHHSAAEETTGEESHVQV